MDWPPVPGGGGGGGNKRRPFGPFDFASNCTVRLFLGKNLDPVSSFWDLVIFENSGLN